jgi:hypothetical protein
VFLKIFVNKELRGVFGLKRDKIMVGWKKLYYSYEEFHSFYSSSNMIRMMEA